MPDNEQPQHYHGHRQRVRARFLREGLSAFQDYEALELLLMSAQPRHDVKPLAKRLIARFGSFKGVLDAPEKDLSGVEGLGAASVTLIHFVKQAATRYLQQTSRAEFGRYSPASLIDYLISSMGALPVEQFRVVCLDGQFNILDEQVVAEGTVDQTAIAPRKVLEIALAARATVLVLAHNHPGGDLSPSHFDRLATDALVRAAQPMNIRIHDHLIISRDGHYSFREHGLV